MKEEIIIYTGIKPSKHNKGNPSSLIIVYLRLKIK